jgi:hypothetical protein
MGRPKRGRPSYDDYARCVAAALRYDIFELDNCTPLAQMPGVKAAMVHYRNEILPVGATLRALLDGVITDIERLAKASKDPTMARIALFLQIWYREHGTVVRVAKALNLSRSTVVHTIQPRAIDLVVKRFLEIAWRIELSP